MEIETPVIVGYFSFDCQEDGYCTYGCGKRPHTYCLDCADTGGFSIEESYHPIMGVENPDYATDICDSCDFIF